MISFSIPRDSLKSALEIVLLAVDSIESMYSHALFRFQGKDLYIYGTDKNRIAAVKRDPVSVSKDESDPSDFTADPRKLAALLKSSDTDIIKMEYDNGTKSLNVYASDNAESKLSMPSYETGSFLPVWENIALAQGMKTLNAGLLMTGINFIQGYLSEDKKNQKFTLLYAEDDTLYGTNGMTKIGAFKSPGFSKLETMMIPNGVIPAISFLINKIDVKDVAIKTTSKHIFISSLDNTACFGFLKHTEKMIKFPVKTEKLDLDGFHADKNLLIKKLNRLSIASNKDVGLSITLEDNSLEIKTMSDRVSSEIMPCTRFKPGDPLKFTIEQKLLKNALKTFPSSEVDIFIENKLYIRKEDSLSISDNESKDPSVIPYISVGIIGLGRSI